MLLLRSKKVPLIQFVPKYCTLLINPCVVFCSFHLANFASYLFLSNAFVSQQGQGFFLLLHYGKFRYKKVNFLFKINTVLNKKSEKSFQNSWKPNSQFLIYARFPLHLFNSKWFTVFNCLTTVHWTKNQSQPISVVEPFCKTFVCHFS